MSVEKVHQVKSGYAVITNDVNLYYEIRSSTVTDNEAANNDEKIIMSMGAFGTLKHFEEEATFLVENFANDTSVQVLTYDYRGIGKSRPAPYVKQTSRMLAEDALLLINKVWGETTPVHVFGASMGGMISQELAIRLIKEKRLRSLFLAVTTRGKFFRPLAIFPPSVASFVLQLFVIKSNREKMIRDVILPTSFAPDVLKEQGERYAVMWINDYDSWFGFNDRRACACQISAVTTHYLTNDRARIIRDANIPVMVQISTRDNIIAPNKQRELARLLNAKTVTFEQGHVVIEETAKQQFFQAFIDHLKEAFHC